MEVQRLWRKFSNFGVSPATDEREKIKIRLLNQLAVVTIGTSICLVIAAALVFNSFSRAFPSCITITICLIVLLANKHYCIKFTRIIACIIFPLWVAFTAAFSGNGVELKVFILCAVLCAIQYDGNQTAKLLSFCYIISLAIISAITFAHFFPNAPMTHHSMVYLNLILVISSIVIIFMMLTFYQYNIRKFSYQKDNLVKQLQVKNEELERFAYITSHDLKEPVRNIQSFAGILKDKLELRENTNVELKLVQIMDTSAKRMASLIDSILEFSKLNQAALTMEQIPLNVLVEDFKLTHSQLIQDKHALIQHADLPTIEGNKLFLSLLFQNLIENGIKYNTSSKPTIQIYSNVKGEQVQISIKDNGIGIEEDFQKTIFEPFKRLHNKSTYEGTGLGLSICKKIVESHDGEIWVESNVLQGSTFVLTLPMSNN